MNIPAIITEWCLTNGLYFRRVGNNLELYNSTDYHMKFLNIVIGSKIRKTLDYSLYTNNWIVEILDIPNTRVSKVLYE